MTGFEVEYRNERVHVDANSLTAEESRAVALTLAGYAITAGIKPSRPVKAAAVILEVLRRRFPDAQLTDIVDVPAVEQSPDVADFQALPFEQQLEMLSKVAI